MKAVQRLAAVFSAVVLVSCGGGSGGGSGAQLDGAIVKGPVLGTSVCAYALVGGAKGSKLNLQATSPGGVITDGCFVTGADGAYAFTVPGYTGEVLIESNGGTFCSDENPVSNGACTAGGAPVTLTEKMTAAASVTQGSRSTTFVTPLTTAAVNNAAAGGGITVEAFRGRFATLAGTVLGDSNITPSSLPTPATQPYLATAAQQMRGGASLSTVVSGLQGGSASSAGTSPATVNAALVGSYDLVFKKGNGAGCGTLCSYTDDGAVHVDVHSDGRLVIGSLSLSNPFHRSFGGTPNLHEVIWLDAAHNIEYALSDNANARFNEINVGNAAAASSGVPAFLGQIRMAQQSGTAALAPLTGTFPLAYQYSGPAVAWTSVTIAADGAVTFTGTGPDVSVGQVTSITDYTNCCGNVQILTSRDFNAVDDSFRIYRNQDGATRSIEYYTGSGSFLTDKVGVRLGTVSQLGSPTGNIPANPGLNGVLANTTLDSSNFSDRRITSNAFSAETLPGTDAGMLLQVSLPISTPIVEGTTYDCGWTSDVQVRMAARLTSGASLLDTVQGGRCKITINSYTAGSLATGRFVAELVSASQDDAPRTIVNGAFHVVLP